MIEFVYYPKGTCSKKMTFEMEGDVVKSLKVLGGCNGNLKGISRILVGMKIDEVEKAFLGVRCGFKQTSCPDQIAKGLEAYRQEYLTKE